MKLSIFSLVLQALILAVLSVLCYYIVHPQPHPLATDALVGEKWEYTVLDCDETGALVGITKKDDSKVDFKLSEKKMSDLGYQGWELCGVYGEVETTFPKDIVSNAVIGPNVRPQTLKLIFKRRLLSTDAESWHTD